MKNVILFLALALIGFSCEKEVTTLPVQDITLKFYAIHACGLETDLQAETPAEWAERIKDLVEAEGIDVLNMELDFEEQSYPEPICGNCMRSGDLVKFTILEEQEQELRDFGFVDE